MKDVQEKNDQHLKVVAKVFRGIKYKIYSEPLSRDSGTSQAAHQVIVHKVEFVDNPHASHLSKNSPTYKAMVKEFCADYQATHSKSHHPRSSEHVQAHAQA